jgi:hypothetical protein
LQASTDNGASWEDVGSTAAPAIIGAAVSQLSAGSAVLFDRINTVEVAMLNSAMTLSNSDDAGLVAGRNLAMLGDEVIQFGSADMLSPGRYRLSGLLRGCFGTEWAIGVHVAGERFVVIDQDALTPISVEAGAARIRVLASGIGDGIGAAEASLNTPGAALVPPAPVMLKAISQTNGDILLQWIRRSRDGWRWLDSVDAPLAEEREAYRITVTPVGGISRSYESPSPSWTYLSAARAADQASGASGVNVAVAQLGTFGSSRLAEISIPLS